MNLFELFVKIGVDDQASGNISKITQGLGSGLKTAAEVGVAAVATITVAATAMTTAFIKGTSEVAAYGDNIDKMSQKMGLSAEAYQEWDFIMQHSGTSIESLQAGMKTLANAVENGNDAFSRLGITQEEIAQMSNEELFSATITALQNVENETERTYLAGQLLGRGATELGALLNTSAEDTEAMRQQVHELGGVMSDEAVKAAAAYQDSLQNMKTAFSGVQRGMLTEFLPSMVAVMDGLALIFSGNDGGIAEISDGVDQFADKLMGAVPKIFEVGEAILSGLATAILDNLPTLTASATSVIMKFVNGIVSALPAIAETAIEIIGSLAQGLASSLPELIPTIVDVVLQIVDTLTNPDTLSGLVDASIAIIIGLADGLIEALPNLLEKAPEIVQNLVEAIVENAPKLLVAAVGLILKLVEFLTNPENLTKIAETAVELISTLIKGFGDVIDGLKAVGDDIVNSIKDGISNAWEGLKTWFNNLWDSLFKDRTVDVDVNGNNNTGAPSPRANGISYVPYDGYYALLHEGERVLTAEENKAYNRGTIGNTSGITIIQNIQSVPQTPVEFAAATEAYFEQARWAFA